MRTKEIVGAILALTIFLGLASIALADVPGTPFQVGGHVYQGTATVSGADVTVTNQVTGESLTTTTDSNGAYVVALGNLPSGHSAGDTIEVTATYSGMTGTNSEPRFESLSDSPQIIDVTLEPVVSIAIKAADGGDLPDSILVGETFTVLITEDGSPVGAGTNVMFTLPYGTGSPTLDATDADGKAQYLPENPGILGIRVLDGTDTTVANATVTVTTTGIQTLGSITISPESCDLIVDGSQTFTAVCIDTNSNGMTCPTLTWDSSSTAIGTITAGEFTAIAAGTTTITASAEDVPSNEALVTVNAPEDSETLSDETNFTLESGNANVTGDFDILVSGDVTVQAVGNVTAHVPDATTVGLGAGYEFISGAIVNVSEDIHNALEGGNGTVTIKLCVSDSILNAMELARSNVQIYVYDEDAEKWVGLTTARVGNTDCHTADISGYLSSVTVGIGSKSAPARRSGGGGRGGTYPPPTTATPAVTATAVSTATPGVTPPEEAVTTPTEPAAEETPSEVAEETPTKKKGIPGFTAVFAIAGLLAIAYAMMRRRD